MTLTKVKTLYDTDFNLWIDETVKQLKLGHLDELDIENLIEEVESLGRSDKRELENRLITLFEHTLKRRYVPLNECYRGWEITIFRTQKEIKRILKDSPSLKNFLVNILEDSYQEAWENMSQEYDVIFPKVNPFSVKIDDLLTKEFWQE